MKTLVACASLLAVSVSGAWAQPSGKGGISGVVSSAQGMGRQGVRGGGAPGVSAAPRRFGGGRTWGGHGRGFQRPPGVYVAPTYPYYPRTYGSPHGFGNVLFPGTGHAPGTFSPFSITDPTFGTRLTNTVSGFGSPYYGGYGYGYGHRQQVVVPYAVPVYVPYPEPQPAPIVVPPPQVIYVVPAEPDRSVSATAPPSQTQNVVTYVVPPQYETPVSEGKKLYLIALKNHSIYSATDYWLEDDTLHYLTPYGAHNQASLDQVDLEFTTRLNRERGIEFRLERRRP